MSSKPAPIQITSISLKLEMDYSCLLLILKLMYKVEHTVSKRVEWEHMIGTCLLIAWSMRGRPIPALAELRFTASLSTNANIHVSNS